MNIELSFFVDAPLLGDNATHPLAPSWPRHAALRLLAGEDPAASARLAWHAHHGTTGCVQLPDLG